VNYSFDQIIAKYREIRAVKEREEAAWKERAAMLNGLLMSLEGTLNAQIIAQQAAGEDDKIQTAEGTAYVKRQTFVAVSDKAEVERYVRDTGDTSFIKWDVTREGVEAYMEAQGGHPPPGVKVTRINKLIVREP
jgi:hypothetical protein